MSLNKCVYIHIRICARLRNLRGTRPLRTRLFLKSHLPPIFTICHAIFDNVCRPTPFAQYLSSMQHVRLWLVRPKTTGVLAVLFSQPTRVLSVLFSQPTRVLSVLFSQPTRVLSVLFSQPTRVLSVLFSQPIRYPFFLAPYTHYTHYSRILQPLLTLFPA